jgi:gastrin-releasing peptide receptor
MNVSTEDPVVSPTQVTSTHEDNSQYVIPSVFAVICVVGFIGNSLLILTVLINREMRTRPNVYIVSLAVGDLILLLVSIPFYSLTYLYPQWPHGSFVCKLLAFLKALSLGVSIFTLTALSWDRYSACLHPIRRHKDTMPKTALTAAAIWLVSILLAVFEYNIASAQDFQYTQDSKAVFVCSNHPSTFGPWFPCFRAWVRFTIYFFIPIIAIAVMYSLMAKSLWSNHAQLPQEPSGENATQGPAAIRQAEARKKIAKLVLTIVVLFCICWLPRHIYLVWFHCPFPGEYNLFWHIWKVTAYCLCFSNSCINPLALCILSDQYRRHFRCYLCCMCLCGKQTTPRVPQRAGTWQTASISVRMHHNKRLSTDVQYSNGNHALHGHR